MCKVPLLLAACVLPLALAAQGTTPAPSTPPAVYEPPIHTWYVTSSGEWIFSMPMLDVNGSDKGSVVRFSAFFNLQTLANYDLSQHAGLFTGLTIRNLGFIYDDPNSDVRYKYRTYNVGVPVGLKLGRMNKGLVFVGYELEFPFNYKEKRFEGGDKKDKFNAWLSSRNEPLYHSVMLGLQTRRGSTLTFKYYLTNFHNTDFTETVDGVEVKPYEGFNANIFYVSLGYALFDGREFLLSPKYIKKEMERHAMLTPTD